MSSSFRRNGLWVSAAALLVAGVYLTAGDRLLGQADAMFAETNLQRLGDVDTSLFVRLDEMVANEVLVGVDSDAARRARRIAEELRGDPAALPSVGRHFYENGCVQPGAAAEATLLGELALRDDVTPIQRRVIAAILLDEASHVATSAVEPLPDEANERLLAQLEALDVGGAVATSDAAEQLLSTPLGELITTEACAQEALDAVAIMLGAGVVDAETLHTVADDTLARLGESSLQPAFVDVAVGAALAAELEDDDVTRYVGDMSLSPAARAKACQRAVAADRAIHGVDMSNAPRAVQLCLIGTGDADAIAFGQHSSDLDLRVAAAAHADISPDEGDLGGLFDHLYDPAAPVSPRLRFATLEHAIELAAEAGTSDAIAALAEARAADHAELRTDVVDAFHEVRTANPQLADTLTVSLSRLTLAPAPSRAADLDGEDILEIVELAEDAEPREVPEASEPGSLEVDLDALQAADPNEPPPELAPELDPRSGPFMLCDVILEAGVLQAMVDDALEQVGPGILCLRDGDYQGSLELNAPGVRLFGLGEDVNIRGGVLLRARATLMSLNIAGGVIVMEDAEGSVLGNNRLRDGVSATLRVSLVGNTLADTGRFIVPGGTVDEEGHVGACGCSGSECCPGGQCCEGDECCPNGSCCEGDDCPEVSAIQTALESPLVVPLSCP